MLLLKNANVYAPKYLGMQDILIEGGKIVEIAPKIEGYEGLSHVETLDMKGKTVVPGYLDNHAHITGGGGEGGPATRTPEARVSELFSAGITTVVGLLGTDSVTRSLENLLTKTKALELEGVSCYCLTGAYGYPPVTLCGSVERDITLVDQIIGVKTAMSDHRSSNPDWHELLELATQARRAGLMASCAGILTIHMGFGKRMLGPVFRALEESDVPANKFLATHMDRNDELFDQGIQLVGMGGNIDVTAGSTPEQNRKLAQMILRYWEADPTADHLSVSSDAYGSQPKFNEKMEYIGLTYSTPDSLHKLVKMLVQEYGADMEKALKLITLNPARILQLQDKKGSIAVGLDADFVVYDEAMEIDSVIAKGKRAIWEKNLLMKGTFEV